MHWFFCYWTHLKFRLVPPISCVRPHNFYNFISITISKQFFIFYFTVKWWQKHACHFRVTQVALWSARTAGHGILWVLSPGVPQTATCAPLPCMPECPTYAAGSTRLLLQTNLKQTPVVPHLLLITVINERFYPASISAITRMLVYLLMW